MATDENNHKNEARDDWTGCTFRVERGPSSEGRAWRCRFLTARRSQRGHVIAEKRLSGLIATQATTTARSRAPSSRPLERRPIDDDGAAPASHYSTIASHHNRRRCHDGGTARPRSPRARPTSSLRERPGRVRS
ncbi:unnamed protein product, partial [Pelagomonas calceolata]